MCHRISYVLPLQRLEILAGLSSMIVRLFSGAGSSYPLFGKSLETRASDDSILIEISTFAMQGYLWSPWNYALDTMKLKKLRLNNSCVLVS